MTFSKDESILSTDAFTVVSRGNYISITFWRTQRSITRTLDEMIDMLDKTERRIAKLDKAQKVSQDLLKMEINI